MDEQKTENDENVPHWSPMEHVATPTSGQTPLGNFFGWQQLRHLIQED